MRPLSDKELRLLQPVVVKWRRKTGAAPRRLVFAFFFLIAFFWVLLLIAKYHDETGPNWYQSLLIAASIVSPFALWAYPRQVREMRAKLAHYEAAVGRNEAQVVRVRADEMIEFEEEEDEGACYAFQLDGHNILFVSGQDYYASAKFPNTDFSLISIYGQHGELVEGFIEKQGSKLKASRKISAKMKSTMTIPDHLQVIPGDLNQIEQLLTKTCSTPR